MDLFFCANYEMQKKKKDIWPWETSNNWSISNGYNKRTTTNLEDRKKVEIKINRND